jgi:hypothetical protein
MATKKNYLLLLLAMLIFAPSCIKDEPDPIKTDDLVRIQNMVIKNNSQELSTRMSVKDEVVTMIPEYTTELKAGYYAEKDFTGNFSFKLRADVDAPVNDGKTLMATHVAIRDNFAFVSYNLRGAEYGGAIEVFDVTVLTQPKIISQALFSTADINSVDFYNGKIYIVGATEVFEEMEFESPAFLQVITVNSLMEIQGVDTIIDIPSFSANGVKVTESKIFVTSGDNGGLTVFDLEYNQFVKTSIADARSVDTNADNVYVLSGQPGTLSTFDYQSGDFLTSFAIGGANTPYSKSELSVNDKYIFAALNEEGVKMVNTDGTIKQHIPKPETPEGELDENHVTNSVSAVHSLVFMANGQSGISVGEVIDDLDDQVVILGQMVFNDNNSSNFVQARDSIVFVASGLGGLKILSISIDEGIPDDIIPTDPCPTLLDAISIYLPERKDATKHSPELFASNVTLNVTTTEETPVYIVFVDEGAGWKNTFGYYAYPADTPPTSVAELQKYVVFPNVSKVDDGGGLEAGDMVQLGTEPFPANTVIGFYLVAQGWANGQMVNGVYTHYTNIEFNHNKAQQHVLFIENGCDDLVLGFEDIRVANLSSDKDFNDIILVIKDNDEQLPNTKFSTEGIVKVNVVDDEI